MHDPDFDDDMSGWQGRVVKIEEFRCEASWLLAAGGQPDIEPVQIKPRWIGRCFYNLA